VPDFDDVVATTADLPDVVEGLSYGTPALRVKGRLFCRLWGEKDTRESGVAGDVLVVFCELHKKEELLADSDGSIFTAPHYDGYGAVLVDLTNVKEKHLAELVRASYLLRAPVTVRRRVLGA
jgi:hypothetical protein